MRDMKHVEELCGSTDAAGCYYKKIGRLIQKDAFVAIVLDPLLALPTWFINTLTASGGAMKTTIMASTSSSHHLLAETRRP